MGGKEDGKKEGERKGCRREKRMWEREKDVGKRKGGMTDKGENES